MATPMWQKRWGLDEFEFSGAIAEGWCKKIIKAVWDLLSRLSEQCFLVSFEYTFITRPAKVKQ